MKTLIFILLKIVEITAAVLTYLGSCYVGYYVDSALCRTSEAEPFKDFGIDFYLGAPLLTISMLAILFLIGMVIWGLISVFPIWINNNKEWSDNIHKRLFKS